MQTKQFGFWLAGALLVLACLAPHAQDNTKWADGTLSMQTYFPVPYAEYNNIYVQNKLDVGASSTPFTMKVGSDRLGQLNRSPLVIEEINIRHGKDATAVGSLTMDSSVQTPQARFGNTNNGVSGAATLQFKNAYIDSLYTSSSEPVTIDFYKVEAEHFKLFGVELPACSKTSWRSINFGSGAKTYLVCCESADDCIDCYFNDSDSGVIANKAKCADAEIGDVTGTWIQNEKPSGTVCGCNCPSNASLDYNGYCRCDTDYMEEDGVCVVACDRDWYRSSHKSECCNKYPYSSNYSDSICWDLKWASQGTEEYSNGQLSSGGCGSVGNWSSSDISGQTCYSPGNTFSRTRKKGAACTKNASYCCNERETFKCKNTISW